MLKNKKAQALLEYAIILMAVMSAALLISNYFRRSLNAKLKRTALGLNAVFAEINQ